MLMDKFISKMQLIRLENNNQKCEELKLKQKDLE